MAITLATGLAIAAGVSAATAIAGGAIGIAGAVQRHEQEKANAKAQEAQMLYNKRAEERAAARTEAETAENVRRQRMQAKELQSRQIALLGKSGAAMSSGSPLAILGESAADTELQIMDTHAAGAGAAAQHREKANILDYHARLARAQRPSGTGLGLSIAGNVLNTSGSLANTAISYKSGKNILDRSGFSNKPLF